MPEIFPLSMGHCHVALIGTAKGFILVDAGVPGTLRILTGELKRQGIGPKEVLLVVVTHAHYDHAGCLAAVRRLTGAEVAVHASEKGFLEQGINAPAPGTRRFSKAVYRLARALTAKRMYEATVPTILVDDAFDLAGFGVAGRIIHTPGHTAGSTSVVLDSGEAFVGDACFNVPIVAAGSVFPPFAADVPALLRSWERLLETGAQTFFPAHGRPFDREKLLGSLARQRTREVSSM